MKLIQLLASWLIVVVVINLVLFILGKISVFAFWSITALIGILAYYVIPYYQKNKR
ncbi:hypothetical protein J4206_01650 [Candidatus Woesearchaeota archaeon]|nr:hypothetical protein [Candidatus Woesearchaeota archaeon]